MRALIFLLVAAQLAAEFNEDIFERAYRDDEWPRLDNRSNHLNVAISETKLLCSMLGVALRKSVRPGERRVGLLDVPMGDFFWMPHCLVQLVRALESDGLELQYHGVDVAPSAVHRAESRRDELQRMVPSLAVHFSRVDMQKPGALARAVRGESVNVVLVHDVRAAPRHWPRLAAAH